MYHKMNFNSMSNLMKAQNLAVGGFVYFEGGKKLHALTPLYNYKCCRTHRSFLQEGYVSFISQILPVNLYIFNHLNVKWIYIVSF